MVLMIWTILVSFKCHTVWRRLRQHAKLAVWQLTRHIRIWRRWRNWFVLKADSLVYKWQKKGIKKKKEEKERKKENCGKDFNWRLGNEKSFSKDGIMNFVSWPETAWLDACSLSLSLSLSWLKKNTLWKEYVVIHGPSITKQKWNTQHAIKNICVTKTKNNVHIICPSTDNATITRALFTPSFLNKVKHQTTWVTWI